MTMKIKTIRQQLGLSQTEMAELLGISQSRVSALERGLEGRSETKIMKQLLKALVVLNRYDLIEHLRKYRPD